MTCKEIPEKLFCNKLFDLSKQHFCTAQTQLLNFMRINKQFTSKINSIVLMGWQTSSAED